MNELLRYDAPVQAVSREATEDFILEGATVCAGERATLILGSANRDERQFDNPDGLDILRTGPRVLSFGHGIHTCLGAALARMEAQIVFGEMSRRFPQSALTDQTIRRRPSRTFRGVQALQVSLY